MPGFDSDWAGRALLVAERVGSTTFTRKGALNSPVATWPRPGSAAVRHWMQR
ncbi:MAG: hypothetical protein K6E40_00165 [Desulfovibrio sp.]|nr:hypothetical protein [Desulfovibrio sp.]